jgi:hypothetical protein
LFPVIWHLVPFDWHLVLHVPKLRTCVLFEVSEIKNYFGPWENCGIWKVTREWKNQRSVHGTLFSVIGTDVPEL